MAQWPGEQYPTLSQEAYDRIFAANRNASVGQSNVLAGQYQTVVDAANRAGVSPSLVASIMAQETGRGQYRGESGGTLYQRNNPGGVMDPANNWRTPRSFGTIQEGIEATAQAVARNWNAGGQTLTGLGNRYAPTNPRPANDPRNLNRHWIPNIQGFLQNISGEMRPADIETLQPPGPEELGLWDIPGNVRSLEEQLAGGPGALLGEAAPWQQPGIISPEYGHYLQTQGLMPANLQSSGGTDFTNTTWNAVPGSQPGWWGPWGAENVHNWAQEGVSHGYGDPIMSMLGNLNYNLIDPATGQPTPAPTPIGPTTGLPNVATGGIDLAHWVAQQWGNPQGTRGLDPGLNIWDATPGVHVLNKPFSDSPNVWDASGVAQRWEGQPDLTFWDASAPTNTAPGAPTNVVPSSTDSHQINVWNNPDVTNWQPAGGTWGTSGQVSPYAGWTQNQQDMFYNPYTDNWGTLSTFGGPSSVSGPNAGSHGSWSPFSGYTGPTFGDFPSGTFAQPIMNAGGGGQNMAVDEWGRVQQNTVPNVRIPPITSAASNTLQEQMHAQAAAAQQQLAQQNQILQQSINHPTNPWANWDTNFVTNFNPQLTFGGTTAFG